MFLEGLSRKRGPFAGFFFISGRTWQEKQTFFQGGLRLFRTGAGKGKKLPFRKMAPDPKSLPGDRASTALSVCAVRTASSGFRRKGARGMISVV